MPDIAPAMGEMKLVESPGFFGVVTKLHKTKKTIVAIPPRVATDEYQY